MWAGVIDKFNSFAQSRKTLVQIVKKQKEHEFDLPKEQQLEEMFNVEILVQQAQTKLDRTLWDKGLCFNPLELNMRAFSYGEGSALVRPQVLSLSKNNLNRLQTKVSKLLVKNRVLETDGMGTSQSREELSRNPHAAFSFTTEMISIDDSGKLFAQEAIKAKTPVAILSGVLVRNLAEEEKYIRLVAKNLGDKPVREILETRLRSCLKYSVRYYRPNPNGDADFCHLFARVQAGEENLEIVELDDENPVFVLVSKRDICAGERPKIQEECSPSSNGELPLTQFLSPDDYESLLCELTRPEVGSNAESPNSVSASGNRTSASFQSPGPSSSSAVFHPSTSFQSPGPSSLVAGESSSRAGPSGTRVGTSSLTGTKWIDEYKSRYVGYRQAKTFIFYDFVRQSDQFAQKLFISGRDQTIDLGAIEEKNLREAIEFYEEFEQFVNDGQLPPDIDSEQTVSTYSAPLILREVEKWLNSREFTHGQGGKTNNTTALLSLAEKEAKQFRMSSASSKARTKNEQVLFNGLNELVAKGSWQEIGYFFRESHKFLPTGLEPRSIRYRLLMRMAHLFFVFLLDKKTNVTGSAVRHRATYDWRDDEVIVPPSPQEIVARQRMEAQMRERQRRGGRPS